MAKIAEFVYKFHSLEGITISARRTSFNYLLGNLKSNLATEKDIEMFLKTLQPRNQLEHIFKLDIIMHFQRNDDLLEILLTGNAAWVGKVLKNWSFFKETFHNVDADTLVNKIFPRTSFTTRTKIINRLSKLLTNEDQLDGYFKAIEEKYGLKVASPILAGCSLELLKTTAENYRIQLTNRQLLQIFKRHQDFLGFYFEILRKANSGFDFSKHYKYTLKYVAKVNVVVYWDLFHRFGLEIKFGKHLTPHVLKPKKKVLKSSKHILDAFNCQKICKIVSETELGEIFVSLYPRDWNDFAQEYSNEDSRIRKFVRNFSKEKQYKMLDKYFFEAYGTTLNEKSSCLTEDLLRIMPESEREVVLDGKVVDEENLIYLYIPQRSIPMLKDKIKHTSEMDKRGKLIYQLLETCKIRHDSESLLVVLKYFLSKHKNDLYILIEFMRKLISWRNIENLSGEHWYCINELLKILLINGKYSNRESNFMEKYLIYLWNHELEFEDQMKAFLKYMKENCYPFNVFANQPKYKKICLEHFGLLIPLMYKGEEYEILCCYFLNSVVEYNKVNTSSIIAITQYPEMIDVLKRRLKVNLCFDPILNYWVRYCFETNHVDDSFFWDHYETQHHCDMLIWYIKANPLKLVENIDKIFNYEVARMSCRQMTLWRLHRNKNSENTCKVDLIFRLLSNYSHLSIPEKLVESALENLPKMINNKINFYLKVLSYFATEQQYFNAIHIFMTPKTGTNVKEIRQVQNSIIRSLSIIQWSCETSNVLTKFCRHGSLKCVKSTLYHVIKNCTEETLQALFTSLYQSITSVRKHLIVLAAEIFTKKEVNTLLKQAGATENNESLKKVLLKVTLKCFNENPSEMLWDLLKSNINLINCKDREAHDILLNLSKIPSSFVPQYVLLVHELLSQNANREINRKICEIPKLIANDLIDRMNLEFLKKLIRQCLFDRYFKSDDSFCCIRLIFHPNEEKREELVSFALKNLKVYVQSNGTDVRNTIGIFIEQFCKHFLILAVDPKNVENFISKTMSIIGKNEAIEEFLLLELTRAYLASKSDDDSLNQLNDFSRISNDFSSKLNDFSSKVNEILLDFVTIYDASVIDIFADVLTKFLSEFINISIDDDIVITFVERLCFTNPSSYTYILICSCPDGFTKKRSEVVSKAILECDVPSVQVFLRRLSGNVL